MNKISKIKLYGNITDWNENSAGNFTNTLDVAKAKNEAVTICMHCYGGNVLEGNVIANSIETGGKVTIQIDGLAASMGAFLLPYAKRVVMARNGYVMLHGVRVGGSDMTISDLEQKTKLLKSMEAEFIAKLTAKTKQHEDIVKSWLVGDNWFSASEALELGIIDEIIEPIADVETLAKTALQSFTPESVYNRYTASLTDNFTNQLNNNEMNKNEIIARFGLTGVTAESSETDVYAAMDRKLEAEKQAREAAENALKAEKSKLIKDTVSAAVGVKITEAERSVFEEIGEKAGIEALNASLNAIKPAQTITSMLSGQQGNSGTNEPKTFTELQALGDAAVTAWKKDRPADYNRLYKAEFGHDIIN